MRKNLDYYLNLPYRIEIAPIPPEEGGGYTATLPEIGRLAIVGDGDTPEEAIRDLELQKRERFAEYLEANVTIPEPKPDADYSGRFVVRIPRRLHRQLAECAAEEGVSLNQFVLYLLTTSLENYPAKAQSPASYSVGWGRQLLHPVCYKYPNERSIPLGEDLGETENQASAAA